MRSKKFIFLVVLFLLLLSQIPFAYRRFKLRRLSGAIQQINSQRAPAPTNGFNEYKGVVHVHSFLGGHSSGSFGEIISAAQANQLQFVIMTEHVEKDFDTAAMTLKDTHGGVLFINGNEVRAENGDRQLVLPGDVSIVAYPEEFKNWDSARLNGVEVYNVFTNAKQANPLVAFFDVLWSQRAYPDLIFALYFQRPDEGLKKWDHALTRAKLTATAGNDAHANIGVSLQGSSGKTLLGIQLDPYEVSFRLVRLHVLIEQGKPLDATSLMAAIRAGHCFIGFDFLGDSTGFAFEAVNGSNLKIQGDEILLQPGTQLRVRSPVPARVTIFKDGSVFTSQSDLTDKMFPITEKGVYRAEIYLPQLGNLVTQKPWIISNPIYVR
ncbi:MAG TPA: hypothetical protein VGQ41_12600 [Pyrinomonadaceae bacterium]|jgi:hypothetical protein|nr:hypothetical protein [Pyrinomonadaceae bacterium]